LGAYVDLPSYIFPNADRLLEYDVRQVGGIVGRTCDTIETRQKLQFFGPTVTVPSLGTYHVNRIIDTVGAGSVMLGLKMHEMLVPEHHFSDEGAYFGLGFTLDLGEPLLSYGPAHPGMLPAELFDGQAGLSDSVRFQTFYGFTQAWNVTFVARWGIGITSIHADMNGHGGTFQTIDWRLVRHVNATHDAPVPVAAYALSSYPNPLTHGATVRYDLPEAGEVTLTVHDMLGRRVATLADGHRSAGTHHAAFHARGLPPGTYLLRLTTAEGSMTRLISLIR
jgi:hypothetical protein